MINKIIIFFVVLYSGIAVLNKFEFKYNNFWDWFFKRNPIIYYEGKRIN